MALGSAESTQKVAYVWLAAQATSARFFCDPFRAYSNAAHTLTWGQATCAWPLTTPRLCTEFREQGERSERRHLVDVERAQLQDNRVRFLRKQPQLRRFFGRP
jgi:hypothetical protein